MNIFLKTMLRHVLPHGDVQFVTKGGVDRFGDGIGPHVRLRITGRGAEWALLFDPDLKLGELYMDGRLIVEEGSIYDFLETVLTNLHNRPYPLFSRILYRIRGALRRFAQMNRGARATANVAHHYDLDAGLYDLFLDSDRQYSCAYFEHPHRSLEEAQIAKKRHIAAKLAVEPGHSVLDIGCGWGGLGLYLADVAGADVTGITLSQEQYKIARQRAIDRWLQNKVEFRIEDYRETQGTFDRIVSVGMFEHVGVPYYDTYFKHCARLLDENGVMLLHTIGRTSAPGATNPWIAKYIFPGGYIPNLSEIIPSITKAGLLVTDIEVLRLHYADTLRAWRERFLFNKAKAEALYDARFVRMWEFYLGSCEASFRCGDDVVYQIQISKQVDTLPVTRRYIGEREIRLMQRERAGLRLAAE
ncbi:replicative DNA helicase [Terrihabitans soli]|uniref:Replicative DNA helicase n=1 Tax=Terrihabitans soli TaxID=708113 RepID=A0A6S6QSC4_9HYPH|nr:cyclopropane-fatty-acyl-phospholipid synthase family protein [Terrihabitans soli]BCJ90837.1 replicative DNA helicase [Terrihabitans soli]